MSENDKQKIEKTPIKPQPTKQQPLKEEVERLPSTVPSPKQQEDGHTDPTPAPDTKKIPRSDSE